MRNLVISDIHGEWQRLLSVLDSAMYNHKKDSLVLLGNYIDRGSNSKKALDVVMDLVASGAIVNTK